jgi:tRNA G18 (ribose-2'-O)-methylase SpoU
MKIIILENIRSAYNVWNIIRTADALWWNVWLSGYTPHPDEQIKVVKTSLWAEENVWLRRFDDTLQAIESARYNWCHVFAWEIVNNAKPLNNIWNFYNENVALILWNEVDWVLKSTLKLVDEILYIPMNWVKESMNVGQSAAIFMWELWK